jgi:Uma2 family endonuclease
LSALDRPERLTVPPLVAGQRLDRATFHDRYEAMPPNVRAELVAGIVYMPSPLGYEHGNLDSDVAGWLFHYRRKTPGLGGAANATTYLSTIDEVQPDQQLRILEDLGGSTRGEHGFVAGPPELIVEIGMSSRSYDLGEKKDSYERTGVREYLFLGSVPEEVFWFARREGRFHELSAGIDGLYRSEAFPGLWLDPSALFVGELDALIAGLERGLATPEHAEFVARLAARR